MTPAVFCVLLCYFSLPSSLVCLYLCLCCGRGLHSRHLALLHNWWKSTHLLPAKILLPIVARLFLSTQWYSSFQPKCILVKLWCFCEYFRSCLLLMWFFLCTRIPVLPSQVSLQSLAASTQTISTLTTLLPACLMLSPATLSLPSRHVFVIKDFY